MEFERINPPDVTLNYYICRKIFCKMMKTGFVTLCLSVCIMLQGWVASASVSEQCAIPDRSARKEFRQAVELFDRGMYDRAQSVFNGLAERYGDCEARGYAVLCAANLQTEGYEHLISSYASDCPTSWLIPQIRYQHALNLFDHDDFSGALGEFDAVSRYRLYKKQIPEFLFKKAYCDFSLGNYDRALLRFKEMDRRAYSDYTAPARFAAGYICYRQKDFSEALQWFSQASKDGRFTSMSDYYMIECLFMLGDHEAVCEKAPELMDNIPQERRPHVIRLISESWLVLGDADKARYWFDQNKESSELRSRSDYFYAGSVLYAVDDYQGAIDKYSMMTDRMDSIGQVANYHLGYCYIQTKNKVAAMEAFKDASSVSYDADITEDAYFNYAKLAFDLNNDTSVFNDYLKKYGDMDRGDKINSYIAVAALYEHDYETAINAYGKIDEMDSDMTLNYMKANYLRAAQLISRSSYRDAVPYLKAAAYYSDKKTMFNQLSRFWIAESYYRNDQFEQAIDLYTELYNISALYKMKEGYLIPYNIAYSHFMSEDYASAAKWFKEYLSGDSVLYRKEASLRYADCLFMQADYAAAIDAYNAVLKDYFRADDIYPYYQAAVSYGLEGDNAKKISLLENVGKADPASPFYPEAYFELGRSYVTAGEPSKATACFDRIVGTVKDSTYIARSLIELGMISHNGGDPDKAIGYFRKVVEEFPLSGCTDDALLAMESVYQSLNEPEKYLAYIDKIGKSSIKTEDEKEMMIFNAAEQIYLSENYQKALVSLQSYMDKYPMGKKVSQAEFYMAECYKNTGQLEKACDYYAKVVDNGSGSFKEMAVLNYSRISYDLQRYDDALGGYESLRSSALLENNRYEALLGMMRSAFRARHYEKAVELSREVKEDSRSDDNICREADWTMAKSYLATSRREEAFAILGALASDPYTSEGAEAAWLIIQDCYDRGDFDEVEKKVYAFSDAQTGQTYWLAKSFIVLGDAFVERGDLEQAEATFKSIEDGYSPLPGGDDVLDNVKMRLSRLGSMISAQAAVADSTSAAASPDQE